MREALSSRTDRFFPLLLVSLTLHFCVLAIGKLLPSAPRFSVAHAPHSIEVALMEAHMSSPPAPPSIPGKPAPILLRAGDAIVVREEAQRLSAPEDIQPHGAKNEPRGSRTPARPLDHQNPSPPYPRIARRRAWEGTVFLRVFVDHAGLVRDIAVDKTSGHALLDKTALETVRKWKFLPAMAHRAPLASWVTIPVQFKLVSE